LSSNLPGDSDGNYKISITWPRFWLGLSWTKRQNDCHNCSL